MLRRLLRYSDQVYGLSDALAAIGDTRVAPQIPTATVLRGAMVMLLTRLGSLNALAQSTVATFWRRWLGGSLASADTTGRVVAQLDPDALRAALQQLYTQLKRNKSLHPPPPGVFALLLDGHEATASFYRRRCAGCLTRVVHTTQGDRVQTYHRHVTAALWHREGLLLLDLEAQRPGEDEGTAAMRLLERVLRHYPRAFELVCGDALYAQAPFVQLARRHGKEVLVVLKDERRDLWQDAEGLCRHQAPVVQQDGTTVSQWWDLESFTSWAALGQPVRVVRAVETTTVRRQRTRHPESVTTEWMWVTTAPQTWLSTAAIVALGHGRWRIENTGFHELVQAWHLDHVYKHHPVALEAFWLLTLWAYNLFQAFCHRNLKAARVRAYSLCHWARVLTSELYADLEAAWARAP